MMFFPSFKTVDFDQNFAFFDPKSRSSVGGFEYNCGDFTIEISKENGRFECVLNENE